MAGRQANRNLLHISTPATTARCDACREFLLQYGLSVRRVSGTGERVPV